MCLGHWKGHYFAFPFSPWWELLAIWVCEIEENELFKADTGFLEDAHLHLWIPTSEAVPSASLRFPSADSLGTTLTFQSHRLASLQPSEHLAGFHPCRLQKPCCPAPVSPAKRWLRETSEAGTGSITRDQVSLIGICPLCYLQALTYFWFPCGHVLTLIHWPPVPWHWLRLRAVDFQLCWA